MVSSGTGDNNSISCIMGYGSTPKHKVISLSEWIQNRNASLLEPKSNTSTPTLPVKQVTQEERELLDDEVNNKEREYDKLIELLEKKITIALKCYSLESDILSQAEELICETIDKYSLRLVGEVLSRIYIHCYDQPTVVAGICSSLERFDATEVSPWGQSIVLGLINHKSDLVKERVISLIENWGDASLLPALRNIDISSTWMREYINGVIAYLEDKKCTM